MPEEEKKTVDIDTSGPDATIDIEETKDEAVVETEQSNQDTRTYEKKKDHGTALSYENEQNYTNFETIPYGKIELGITQLSEYTDFGTPASNSVETCLLYTSPSPRD